MKRGFLIILMFISFYLFGQEADVAVETEETAEEEEETTSYEGSFSLDEGDSLEALLEGDDMDFIGGPSVVSAESIEDNSIQQIETGVFFTGDISASGSYNFNRDWMTGDGEFDDNLLSASIEGNFYVDVRLKKGFKAFLSIGAGYLPSGTPVSSSFTEIGIERKISNFTVTTNVPVGVSITTNLSPFSIEITTNYANITGTNSVEIIEVVTNTHTMFETNELVIGVKEFFVDLNIAKRVYFRTGKQVIQWGRGYLWNPTDLINAEKKDFFDMSGVREGTYGIRMHIPFGTIVNIYSFFDASDNVRNFNDFAAAAKVEALIGGFECSISGWWKDGYYPLYGFDFSTRIPGIDVDLRGEISLSYGANKPLLRKATSNISLTGSYSYPSPIGSGTYEYEITVTNTETYKIHEEVVPKFAIGLGRAFTIADVEDRLMINLEYYYNHLGYDENLFEDDIYKAALFQTQGAYEPSSHGKHYAALFTSFSKFIVTDMNLSLNAIANLSDLSFIVTTSLSYSPIDNLTLSTTITGYIGEENREYTLGGNALATSIEAGFVF